MGITLDGIASAQLAKHLYHVTHYHNGETKKTDFGYFQLDIADVLHNRLPIVCFYMAYFREEAIQHFVLTLNSSKGHICIHFTNKYPCPTV